MLTDSQIRDRLILPSGEYQEVNDVYDAFTRSRWVSADDMVGIQELSQFFGVGASTVTGWGVNRERTGMPEPITRLGATPVYSLHEVVSWWVDWKPKKRNKAGNIPTDYKL